MSSVAPVSEPEDCNSLADSGGNTSAIPDIEIQPIEGQPNEPEWSNSMQRHSYAKERKLQIRKFYYQNGCHKYIQHLPEI